MHILIIGAGSIGERHLRNFLRVPGVRCSIAEPNPAVRQRVAAAYPLQAAYADQRDADLAAFDGVVLCVPTHLHVAMASQILAAGVHVLTEKPLAMSLDGVDDLKRIRDEKRLVASVAFCYRLDPLVNELRDRTASGELGTVRWIQYYAGQYWPRMRKDYPPAYAQKRETGGGAIPDHLVHVINYLEWVFGPVASASAWQWNLALKDIATEDAGGVCLRFASGPVAQLGICLFQRDTNSRLQIVGDKGTIRIEYGAPRLSVFRDAEGAWQTGAAAQIERDDLFRDQARHFIDCIQGKAVPRCTIEDGEQTLRTMLAILKSVDGDGRFVPVTRP